MHGQNEMILSNEMHKKDKEEELNGNHENDEDDEIVDNEQEINEQEVNKQKMDEKKFRIKTTLMMWKIMLKMKLEIKVKF